MLRRSTRARLQRLRPRREGAVYLGSAGNALGSLHLRSCPVDTLRVYGTPCFQPEGSSRVSLWHHLPQLAASFWGAGPGRFRLSVSARGGGRPHTAPGSTPRAPVSAPSKPSSGALWRVPPAAKRTPWHTRRARCRGPCLPRPGVPAPHFSAEAPRSHDPGSFSGPEGGGRLASPCQARRPEAHGVRPFLCPAPRCPRPATAFPSVPCVRNPAAALSAPAVLAGGVPCAVRAPRAPSPASALGPRRLASPAAVGFLRVPWHRSASRVPASGASRTRGRPLASPDPEGSGSPAAATWLRLGSRPSTSQVFFPRSPCKKKSLIHVCEPRGSRALGGRH